MPIRNLDTDQKFAATATGDEVVVSAGAGSGKTMLLVGRYLHLLKNADNPVSSIVAITFTNKAADQMKTRIIQKALELAEEHPGEKDFWSGEVAAQVHSAPISTIHSFCNSLLRTYPVEAELDPLFTIADDATLFGLTDEAITGFMNERYFAEPESIDHILATYGAIGFKGLLNVLLKERSGIIKYLDENGNPTPEMLEGRYRKYIRERLGKYLETLRDFHVVRPGDDSLSPILDNCVTVVERILDMAEQDSVDEPFISSWIDTILPIGNKGSQKKWGELGLHPKEVRSGMKESLAFIERVLSFYLFEKNHASHVVSDLLREFKFLDSYFLRMKKSRSFLDHDDTLIETWRLLRKNVGIRKKVSGTYRHILVDEFQDTDGIQMDIIRMIADAYPSSLFTVGDPKQSIYRFRGADVTIFNDFKARPNVEFKSLKINYRSAPAIINFINHAFTRIMGSDDPEYRFETSYRDMKPYRKQDDSGVEISVFDAENVDICRAAEAESIAAKAAEMKEKHGITYNNMALILRKGTNTAYYEQAFLAHTIPFVNLTSRDPFDNAEAYDCANLLGWLCNPDDPVLFTGLLLSPFFGVSADFLFTLRERAGKECTMPAYFLTGKADDIGAGSGSKIRDSLTKLLSLHERLTIRDILEMAFDETGYTLTLLADPLRGEHSLSVIDHILVTADTFEAQGGCVTRFTQLLMNGELSSDNKISIETGLDTLTIITIHRAKGMEYRVVFLADVSSRPVNSSKSFLIHEKLGPGIDIRDACRKPVKTLVKAVSQEEEIMKDRAESKRLFYVGCTRAQDFLIISGGKPSKEIDEMYEKDNWMGWLHAALDISPDGEYTSAEHNELFSYNRIQVTEALTQKTAEEALEQADSDSGTALSDVGIYLDKLSEPLPEIPFSGKPVTLSPTQVIDYRDCPACYLYRNVYRISGGNDSGGTGGEGARYGTFAHRILQRWDFNDVVSSLAHIDELADSNIKDNQRQKLSESLLRFTETELYRQIRSADELRREEPFAFIHDDVLFRGTIDVLFTTGNSVSIVDYKTGNPEKLTDDPVSSGHTLQLGIYALAVKRAQYVIPSRLVIYYISHSAIHELSCSEAFLNSISGILTDTITSLDAGNFSPKRQAACKDCHYLELCEDDAVR